MLACSGDVEEPAGLTLSAVLPLKLFSPKRAKKRKKTKAGGRNREGGSAYLALTHTHNTQNTHCVSAWHTNRPSPTKHPTRLSSEHMQPRKEWRVGLFQSAAVLEKHIKKRRKKNDCEGT